MTESSQVHPAAADELLAVATWIDGELAGSTDSQRQTAAEASARIKAIAVWLRGGTRPGQDLAAEELRLEEARKFIEDTRGRGLEDLPPSVLERTAAELLRHASWLCAVLIGDPELATTTLRARPADQQAGLAAEIAAAVPGGLDSFEQHLASDLARFNDDTAEIVLAWLRRAAGATKPGQ